MDNNNNNNGICYIKKEFLKPKPQENSKDDVELNSELNINEPKEKGKRGGLNKKRKTGADAPNENEKLCTLIALGLECDAKENCKFSHDIDAFLEKKQSLEGPCVNFELYGKCHFGIKCVFSHQHTDENKKQVHKEVDCKSYVKNAIPKELMKQLRSKSYAFKDNKASQKKETIELNESEEKPNEPSTIATVPIFDVNDAPFFQKEDKKKIDFKGKLYLAPLTTVGNLPFRRICKEFGADITCGEMAVSSKLLQGYHSEWALMKRHISEDIFGVQICGNNPAVVAKSCQIINEQTEVDFVDLNVGCPIDFVFQQGAGSALLERTSKLQRIVAEMKSNLDCMVTLKCRMGVACNKPVTHNLMPKFRDWGVDLVTVHGRSRQQRYTKLADWDYIQKCAQQVPELPVFGNGDILSFEDFDTFLKNYQNDIAGTMIARGALIKPWIFTEIKEHRHWDISSKERFDIMRKFTHYGLEHWGTDALGVNSTRRFLCEWQSFLYRYVPVGILERVPQRINERPEAFVGRDDLETLMASPNVQDWIKLTEMLLGPADPNFKFIPKHKSNSYEG